MSKKKEESVEKLRTVNIKGKEYVEVSERLRYFRSSLAYEGWRLTTSWLEHTEKRAMCIAMVLDGQGQVIATGTAYEEAGSNFINKTSYIENCETSAWGRALGNLGIGIEGAVASALEVGNAVKNQGPDNKKGNPPPSSHPAETYEEEPGDPRENLTGMPKQNTHRPAPNPADDDQRSTADKVWELFNWLEDMETACCKAGLKSDEYWQQATRTEYKGTDPKLKDKIYFRENHDEARTKVENNLHHRGTCGAIYIWQRNVEQLMKKLAIASDGEHGEEVPW